MQTTRTSTIPRTTIPTTTSDLPPVGALVPSVADVEFIPDSSTPHERRISPMGDGGVSSGGGNCCCHFYGYRCTYFPSLFASSSSSLSSLSSSSLQPFFSSLVRVSFDV